MRSKVICMSMVGLLVASSLSLTALAADESQQQNVQQPVKQIPGEAASDQNLRRPGVMIKPGFKAWINEESEPWCAILCVHGLTLHKDSYARLANRLSDLGVATYAMDVRGFGDNRKIPGREKIDFDGTFADINEHLLYIRDKYPTIPVFLAGESMGGALALQSSARFPHLIDGTLSSVPHANARWTQFPKMIGIALKGLIMGPNAEVDVESIAREITDKPKLENKLASDPRVRTRISVRELADVYGMMKQNKKLARDVKVQPLMIVQGWRDKLIKPNDSVDIMNKVASPNKDLVIVGQSEHLILEEGQYTDYVIDSLLSWFDKRSPKSPIVTPSELNRPAEVVKHHKPDEEVFRLLRLSQNFIRKGDLNAAAEYRNKALELAGRDRSPHELSAWLNTLPAQLLAPMTGPGTEQLFVRSGLQVASNNQASPVVVLVVDSKAADKKLRFQNKLLSRYSNSPHVVAVDIAKPEGMKVARTYGVLSAPAALLLDRNRVVRDVLVSRSEKELRAHLEQAPVALSLGRFMPL